MTTTTGSHPAIKMKKVLTMLKPEAAGSKDRRQSMMSQAESSSGSVHNEVVAINNPFKRRQSLARPGGLNMVQATMALRRLTKGNIADTKKYENTYKMEPDEGKHFTPQKAQLRIEALLEAHLKDVVYDPQTAGPLAGKIAESVKKTMKSMECPRYKLISTVVIGQCCGQDLEAASRCLWDETKDNSATIVHRTKNIFAVVTVFAAYFD